MCSTSNTGDDVSKWCMRRLSQMAFACFIWKAVHSYLWKKTASKANSTPLNKPHELLFMKV